MLNRDETGGLELTWGNSQAIVTAAQALADGVGFGAVLALGSKGAADRLGRGHEYLQTVRGIGLPMHDPKLLPGLARTYQYDPSPARHVKGGIGFNQMGMGREKYNTEGTRPRRRQGDALYRDVQQCRVLHVHRVGRRRAGVFPAGRGGHRL